MNAVKAWLGAALLIYWTVRGKPMCVAMDGTVWLGR